MEINLMPWRETRNKKQRRFFYALLIIGCLFIFCATLLIRLHLNEKIHVYQNRKIFLANKKAEIHSSHHYLEQNDKYQQLINNIRLINAINMEQKFFLITLQKICTSLPNNLYLTMLIKNDNQWIFHGNSNNYQSVTKFTQNLTKNNVFSQIHLSHVTTSNSGHLVMFTINSKAKKLRGKSK